MSWKPEIDELKKRAELAEELGGKKSRNYQHSIGKILRESGLTCF